MGFGYGLSPTGLRFYQQGNRIIAVLGAYLTSLKSWFLLDLKLWKETPMRKALEFGLRVVAFELFYTLVASYGSGAPPG
jgi:hypothetical protein